MAAKLPALTAETKILDIGAGYGGAMRRLVGRHGGSATCLNISVVQNDTNRHKVRRAGLGDRIRVVHGVFEDIPEPSDSQDVVWSQDALLHSDQRQKVLQEVWRVLKPGGLFVFTDPCQADDVPEGVLQPVYDRLQLSSLGSFRFYREAAEGIGFETVEQEDMTHNLRTHYARVREEMLAGYDRLRDSGASADYLDKMAVGLENWVKAADAGHLRWGIQLFRKPR
jgi:sarcosine/dimethylglycine N-methyltransferase